MGINLNGSLICIFDVKVPDFLTFQSIDHEGIPTTLTIRSRYSLRLSVLSYFSLSLHFASHFAFIKPIFVMLSPRLPHSLLHPPFIRCFLFQLSTCKMIYYSQMIWIEYR